MGKIRIKTLGIEEIEKDQAKDAKKRREGKQAKKLAKGAHGGDLPRGKAGRVVSMAPTEEELERLAINEDKEESTESAESVKSVVARKKSKKAHPTRSRSKRYRDGLIQVDRNKNYSLSEAIELLKKLDSTRFDATVELHINTTEKGINAQVTLPHGTGKVVRVAIANPSAGSGQAPATDGQFDNLISQIEQGKIDFDVLIAHPSAMPKLAKVAKILGPRGLMPNPKSGTISDKPKELAERFKGGQLNFRSESQAPIIHAAVGKVSFKEKDLSENITEFLKAVGVSKIRSVTLKSTMSPGIKIDFSSL